MKNQSSDIKKVKTYNMINDSQCNRYPITVMKTIRKNNSITKNHTIVGRYPEGGIIVIQNNKN